MIKYKTETVMNKVEVSIICDCCKKEYSDILDKQEFLCINAYGGYNSAIGDEVHYQCDLCSSCLKVLLGEYLRYPKQKVINAWQSDTLPSDEAM